MFGNNLQRNFVTMTFNNELYNISNNKNIFVTLFYDMINNNGETLENTLLKDSSHINPLWGYDKIINYLSNGFYVNNEKINKIYHNMLNKLK